LRRFNCCASGTYTHTYPSVGCRVLGRRRAMSTSRILGAAAPPPRSRDIPLSVLSSRIRIRGGIPEKETFLLPSRRYLQKEDGGRRRRRSPFALLPNERSAHICIEENAGTAIGRPTPTQKFACSEPPSVSNTSSLLMPSNCSCTREVALTAVCLPFCIITCSGLQV